MNPRRIDARAVPAIAASLMVLVLVACSRFAGGASSPSAATSPSATAPSESASSVASPSSEPTDDLGAFVCELPIEGDGTVAHAQITDVRVGSHDGYDRVVIEFDEGIPPYILQAAMPPLLSDPAGMEMDVAGTAFRNLVLLGGTRVTEDGELTYDGRTDFTPDFPVLAELVESGDFEATSAWYLGLHQDACARVLTLADPSRLVVDIEH
ncbi:MAG TPA: hypothetical protein VIC83_08645 [Candidatus Limnocylindria bacterium]